MVVCTTRHWQTSGRLVQELNVSTLQLMTFSDAKKKLSRSSLEQSFATRDGYMHRGFTSPFRSLVAEQLCLQGGALNEVAARAHRRQRGGS